MIDLLIIVGLFVFREKSVSKEVEELLGQSMFLEILKTLFLEETINYMYLPFNVMYIVYIPLISLLR